MENLGYTNAPGKGLLKVSGILLIIFAAIGIIALILTMVAAGAAASLGGDFGALAGGLVIVGLILGLAGCVFSLIMGILGVKYANVPSKATVCMVFAIITIALQLISLIMNGGNGIVMGLIGLVLPVLYLIGALQNKKVAA